MENPNVQAGLTWQSVSWAWTAGRPLWRPMMWLSFQLDRELFGPGPAGFHRTSLLLHVGNGVLLFCVLRKLSGRLWRPAIVAGLFSLHPLHVETFAWVSQRTDLVCTFFGLLSIWAYGAYAARPTWVAYIVVASSYALSLFAKPMLITLPALFLLLDFWPLARFRRRECNIQLRHYGKADARNTPTVRPSWLDLCHEKLLLVGIGLAIGSVAYFLEPKGSVIDWGIESTLDVRIRSALIGYVRYLARIGWPSGLLVWYMQPFPTWSWFHAIGAAGLLAGITGVVFRLAGERPYLVTGWLWYLGTLLPAIGVVSLRYYAFADRYTYVPLIGIFITVVWGAADLLRRWNRGPILGGALAVAVLLTCLICSSKQAAVWHNSYTLWTHALRVDPDNVIANIHLGSWLIKEGRSQEAEPFVRKGLEECQKRGYTCAYPYRDLADALWLQGNTNEAIPLYLRALEIDPYSAKTHHKVGLGLLGQGNSADAEGHFLAALALEPQSPQLHSNLGASLYNQGRLTDSITHFTEAVRLKPDYANGHNMLGMALERQGKLAEAIQQYSEAVKLDPGLSEANQNLVRANAKQRR